MHKKKIRGGMFVFANIGDLKITQNKAEPDLRLNRDNPRSNGDNLEITLLRGHDIQIIVIFSLF